MTSILSGAAAPPPLPHRPHKAKGAAEGEHAPVPDSTTSVERERAAAAAAVPDLKAGQDVLLKHQDGRYYLGTVVEVDAARERCLVRFGDNTQSWGAAKDLTKLTAPDWGDLLCVVCKKSAPKDSREIVVCDRCGRGYHRSGCDQPQVAAIDCQKDKLWVCRRCMENEPLRQRKSIDYKELRNETIRRICSGVDSKLPTSIPIAFPYQAEQLSWDTYHRVNMEQIYCYCGRNGEWYTQMLQCGRCRQWFHEKCLHCLQYPLYCGDRFYVFVCAICNNGREFLRRLELKWVDLVHLMLFNLTAFNAKKYYDLDTVIIPYINDNWHALQLPPKIANVTKTERRDNILSVLTNNRNRFKCGREIKKRTTIWGLRVRLPPPAPCVNIPQEGRITDQVLRTRWHGNRRLQFLNAQETSYTSYSQVVVPVDGRMANLMMGTAYQENNGYSETESPCPSPIPTEDVLKVFKMDFLGGGCAKKSAFPKVSPQRRKVRRGESVSLTPPTCVSAPPTPPTSSTSNSGTDLAIDFSEHSQSLNDFKELNTPCDTSGDETSSKSTLDLIIPPPKDFKGKNNPFLGLLKDRGEELGKKRRSKDAITLPLPLTAVIPGRPVARPMKRQLSEKDICIGPNGEVKRRRLRRGKGNPLNYGTASKTATVVPVRPDAKEWGQRNQQLGNCFEYALNARRLRQRHQHQQLQQHQQQQHADAHSIEKDKSNPATPKASPVKSEPDIDLDDLKSSVNIYFGAANRIAAGERFNIKAKRFGPTGKLQYLIEWDGPSNGMT